MKNLPKSAQTAPPAVTVVEFSDPTSVGEGIELIEQDAVLLASKRLRARRVVVRLGSCLVVFHSTNLPIRTRTKMQSGLVAFVAFGPRAVGTVNGLPAGPDRVLAAESEMEVEFVVAAGYESVSFLLPIEHFNAHLRSRHLENEFPLPRGVELRSPRLSAAQELFRWGRRLIDMAERQPEIFDLPRTQAAAQIELLESLVSTLGFAVHAGPALQDSTRQAHSRVVRIAEDYALSHSTERVYLTDLCQATGVSERTLQYAFNEVMGMTPVSYLTRLRLHRVRKALRASTHGTTTVSAEALRWGFWHFGDFSRAYRDCFGELPSETLRHGSK